jgi:steroid 5-alpha reductase family enzyme
MLTTWAIVLAALLALFAVVWVWATLRRDVSVVDAWWSLGFLVAAAVAARGGGSLDPRKTLVLILVAAWALRLSAYLAWRNHGEPEDRRYAAMRQGRGPAFWWQSLFVVFWLQAALVAVICLPHLVVLAAPVGPPLGFFDALGLLLWVIGFCFETIGDAQLAGFKANPNNRGKVLDRGVWAWTRHPNYFGEACLWWGFGAIALAVPNGWMTLPSVALMTFLLLRVSGVTLLERDIGERRPAYRDYIARTSAFFPRPPRPRKT